MALLRHPGAEVTLTPGILMSEAAAEARRIVSGTPDAVLLDQFANPASPQVHRRPGSTRCPALASGSS